LSIRCIGHARGFEGGAGGKFPPRGALEGGPSRKKIMPQETCHIFRCFFGTCFFVDGFLFLVKELGFLTNPGHWVRVLDAANSYMYIVL
jgi:hypothetical protein